MWSRLERHYSLLRAYGTMSCPCKSCKACDVERAEKLAALGDWLVARSMLGKNANTTSSMLIRKLNKIGIIDTEKYELWL